MQTKAIKEKIKSIGGIKKITKTMEMISVSKMKKAIDSALLLRPFKMEAEAVLSQVYSDTLSKHELLTKNNVKGDVVVIIASNKGLCGSYNINLYRTLTDYYSVEERKDLKVIAIGKHSEKMAKKLHVEALASFDHPLLTSLDAHTITTMLINWYKENKIGTVRLLYTYFSSPTHFTPTLLQLLPFSPSTSKKNEEVPYSYEPSQESVLSSIIPIMLHNIIYGAILESYASEHSSRMFAMKNATDSAKELEDSLMLYYNRARQGAVTQEIAEITRGAMALNT